MILVDSTALCHIASYTVGELSDKDKPTGMMFGFLNQIFTIANEFNTNQFVFCWDSKKSYRREVYPEYKRNRHKDGMTEQEIELKKSFYRQNNFIRTTLLKRLGFQNSFICTGLEADDLLAYFAMRHPDNIMVTNDNDLFQMLDYCDIYSSKTKSLLTAKEFIKKNGIKPSQWTMIKQIAGCDTDNVKGIEGIGIKRAIKYLQGGLKGKFLDCIKSKEGQEIIVRNERLVKLPFEPNKLDELSEVVVDEFRLDDWLNIFQQYSFNSFLKKGFIEKKLGVFNLR